MKVCANCIFRKKVKLAKASIVGVSLFPIFAILIVTYIVGNMTVTMTPLAQRQRMASRAKPSSRNNRFDVLIRTAILETKKRNAIPNKNHVTNRSWKAEARGRE